MSSRHKVYEKGYDDRRPAKGGRTRSPDSPPRKKDDKKSRTALNTGLNDYFIDGDGIHRDVLQRQICFMLGNQATCRPEVYNGVSGYMIKAVRPFTNEQLDDLQEISSQYMKEKARFKQEQTDKYKGRGEIPTLRYDQSETLQNFTPRTQDTRPLYQDEPQYPPGPYPSNTGQRDLYGGSQAQYIPSSNASYQTPGGYSPGPQMTNPPYQAPLHSSSRPITNEPPMGYGRPDRASDRDPYLQSNQYGPPPPRDYGMDPRDPRYIPQVDMGRGNRPQQSMYAQPQFNPQDVVMQDQYDPGYGPMEMDPGRQPPRIGSGYPPQNARMPVDHYDDRLPPDQGSYKMSYPREEKRHRDDYDRRRH